MEQTCVSSLLNYKTTATEHLYSLYLFLILPAAVIQPNCSGTCSPTETLVAPKDASRLVMCSVKVKGRRTATTEGAAVYLVTSRLQPWTCRADFPLLAHSLPTDPHGEWSGTGREVDRDWRLLLYRLRLKTIIPMIHRSVSSLSPGQATGTGIGALNYGAPQGSSSGCIVITKRCTQTHKRAHTQANVTILCVDPPLLPLLSCISHTG